jgi:hypothetical protein
MAEGGGVEPLTSMVTLAFKASCRPLGGTFRCLSLIGGLGGVDRTRGLPLPERALCRLSYTQRSVVDPWPGL